MIQDKDYTLRLIRQFIQALEKLILDKPKEKSVQDNTDYDTVLKDIFKLNFNELVSKSVNEITVIIASKQERDHKEYYEMLGNLFYLEGKKNNNHNFLKQSKIFYELYLEKSGIYSLPIMQRIQEVNV